MQFNNYNLYSKMSDIQSRSVEDLNKVNEIIEMLKATDNPEFVRDWLKSKYDIKDDISNLAITPNLRITVKTCEHKLNVVVLQDKAKFSYLFI